MSNDTVWYAKHASPPTGPAERSNMNRAFPDTKQVAPDANLEEAQPRKRGSGVQLVYRELRQGILELSIKPGTILDESQLSARFKMSRTPIREALVRLAAENLITTLPNRTSMVPPIDFSNLPAYFDALTLMYRISTRSAAELHNESDLVEIRRLEQEFAQAVGRRDALAMISRNRDFHVAIARAGKNTYYEEFFARLLDEGRRILRLYYESYDDALPRQYVQEHEQLVDAIATRNVDLADDLAKQHAAQIVRQIQSYLATRYQSDLPL